MPRRSTIFAACLLLCAAGAVPYALRVPIDNRLELWVRQDSSEAADYAAFRADFGSDEFVLIAYTADEIFSPEALDTQLEALDKIEAVPEVRQVLSVPGIFRSQFGGEDASELAGEIRSRPAYRNLIYAPDPETCAFLIETAPPDTPDGRRSMIAALSDAAKPLLDAGFHVYTVGPPALNVTLDETSRREALRTFPPAFGAGILVLLLLFRGVRATLAATASAGLTILLTLGLMGSHHGTLNMISSALPTLLWVLSLASAVHIVRRYQEQRAAGTAVEAALDNALAETRRPCFVAAITTAAGFLALLTADMRPVRELGIYAASGIMLSIAVNLTILPLLLRAMRTPGLAARRRGAGAWTGRWSSRAVAWRRATLVAAAAAFIIGILSISRIRVESDPLTFLPEDDPAAEAYDFVAENLTGFYTLETVVDAPMDWRDPGVWETLESLTRDFSQLPGVARVLSPLDMLKLARAWDDDAYALPESRAEAERLLDTLDDDGKRLLNTLVSADGRRVRLPLFINVMQSDPFLAITSAVSDHLRALPPGWSAHTTGLVPQLVDAQLSLVRTQIRSFSLSFLVVFACIGIGLRSMRLMLVSVLPNLFPILAGAAVMAALGIPLDAATVMAASIALGIAVDDTVHLLATWQTRHRAGVDAPVRVRDALGHVAPAMLITTVVACIGFFALVRSAFLPIACFGLLSGIAMIAALWADFFLVPALLLYRKS